MHFSFFELDVFSESIYLLQTTLGAIADWMTSNLYCALTVLRLDFYCLLGLQPQLSIIHHHVLALSNYISVSPSASARNFGLIAARCYG